MAISIIALAQNSEVELPESSPQIQPLQSNIAQLNIRPKEIKLQRINLTNLWIRLSISGKSQLEIESYLGPDVDIELINYTKQNLRQIVINSLSLRIPINLNIYTTADLNSYSKIAYNLVSYYGLEQDQIIRTQINKKFGLAL